MLNLACEEIPYSRWRSRAEFEMTMKSAHFSQGDKTFPVLQYLAGCPEGVSLSSLSNIPIIHNIVH